MPVLRLAFTFAIVWFYVALTAGFVSGVAQAAVVVALAVPTWLVLSRLLFPADGTGPVGRDDEP